MAGLALAACDPYVQGNGVFLEEDRSASFGPFVGVHVEDGIRVTVTAGAEQQSVRVSGDANVLQYVRTEIREEDVGSEPTKILYVMVDAKDFDATIPVSAVLAVREIRYLFATQGARLAVSGAATPLMVVDARDGSTLLLAGAGGAAIQATLNNAEVDAGSYPVDAASVALTNHSRIELHSDGPVIGTADATSEVDNLLGDGTCLVPGGGKLCCKPALTCP